VCVAHGTGRPQNNEIEVLENLPLKKLQKLYVEGNRISCAPLVRPTPPSADAANGADDVIRVARLVKGLDDCERLEELHINRQRLNPLGPGLQFDPMCMRHIANTLCVLKAQVRFVSSPSTLPPISHPCIHPQRVGCTDAWAVRRWS
jgi:hypothetical protein